MASLIDYVVGLILILCGTLYFMTSTFHTPYIILVIAIIIAAWLFLLPSLKKKAEPPKLELNKWIVEKIDEELPLISENLRIIRTGNITKQSSKSGYVSLEYPTDAEAQKIFTEGLQLTFREYPKDNAVMLERSKDVGSRISEWFSIKVKIFNSLKKKKQ